MSSKSGKTVEQNCKDRCQKVIENIDHLPSLPQIVIKLIEVVNSSDTSADDAARLIEKDPAMTSRLIRLANSAFYGVPRSVSSVSSAVVILGFNVIRSLVLSVSVMEIFSHSKEQAISKKQFWIHSIVTAMAAKDIARHLMNFKMMDPESAFCAGILHDIGKLIFNEFLFDEYLATCEYARNSNAPLLEAESKILGINHAEVGRHLADRWALPLDLEHSLVYHHDPSGVEEDDIFDLVAVVHFADRLAHHAGAGFWQDETLTPEWVAGRERLHIDNSAYDCLQRRLVDSMGDAGSFLSIIN